MCSALPAGNDLLKWADNPGGTSDWDSLLPSITSACRHGGICSVCSAVLKRKWRQAPLASLTKPRRENTITFIASCLFFFLCTFFNSCVTLPRGALKLSGFVSCLSVYKEEIINQESGFCACVRLSLYVWRVWTWKRRTKERGEDARTRFTLFWFMHFSNFPKFVATNKIKVEGEEMASKDKDHSCTFSSKIMWKHLILSN